MSLEEFINKMKTNDWTMDDFDKYVKSCGGLTKLKKRDLDIILNQNGYLLRQDFFMDIYKIVSDNESGKAIRIWTWIAGIATVISLFVAIIEQV